MKKVTTLLAVVVLSITIFSCTKDGGSSTSSTTQPPQPKLQFYGNGVLYNFDAMWDSRVGWISYPAIVKDSTSTIGSTNTLSTNTQKSSNGGRYTWINLGFPCLLNSIGTYTAFYNNTSNNAMFDCSLNQNNGWIGTDTITVSSLSNGLASGTFVGTVQLLSLIHI